MSTIENRIVQVLKEHLSEIIVQSIVKLSVMRTGVDLDALSDDDCRLLLQELSVGFRLYLESPAEQEVCEEKISAVLKKSTGASPGVGREEIIPVNSEADIVIAREMGRRICGQIGFLMSGQVKVATAISELARNIVQYAGSGSITLRVIRRRDRQGIEIISKDNGPGISNLEEVLSGSYVSRHGMGKGLTGCRSLMDEFDIVTAPEAGTTITLRKFVG